MLSCLFGFSQKSLEYLKQHFTIPPQRADCSPVKFHWKLHREVCKLRLYEKKCIFEADPGLYRELMRRFPEFSWKWHQYILMTEHYRVSPLLPSEILAYRPQKWWGLCFVQVKPSSSLSHSVCGKSYFVIIPQPSCFDFYRSRSPKTNTTVNMMPLWLCETTIPVEIPL